MENAFSTLASEKEKGKLQASECCLIAKRVPGKYLLGFEAVQERIIPVRLACKP